jgi:catechol 2,3-dioxygenase-like lactoylglutathione lyase family enzyme
MKLVVTAALACLLASPAYAQLAPYNAAGMTYGHVHLRVKDVEVQKKLWVEQFGATIVQKGPLVAAKLPNMLIAFQAMAPTGPSEGTVMDHFGFKVKNMQEIIASWKKAGYTVTREFLGAEGFPNAYLAGPDDLKIELQEDKNLPVKVSGYHIHFLTPDYQKLMAWYVDVFGVTPRKRGTIDTTADAPGMNLSFQTADKPTGATKGHTIDHIGFEFRDLAAFCKQLEAKGIKLDVPFREVPQIGLKIAYITDPNGVYIELTQGYSEY